jgi:RimJ/RimL family protein N-acetyltransferase
MNFTLARMLAASAVQVNGLQSPLFGTDWTKDSMRRGYRRRVVVLRTERVVLRPWQQSDRAPFAELNADPEVMQYFRATLTNEQSDALVDRITAAFDRQRGWGLWALEERSTGRFLGFTGLAAVAFTAPFTPATEIGWRLRRDAWGHGYATEAAGAALAFAFAADGLELRELVSFTAEINVRSRAVMQRVGMRYDPTDDFDHPALPGGHPLRRHVLYRVKRPPSR